MKIENKKQLSKIVHLINEELSNQFLSRNIDSYKLTDDDLAENFGFENDEVKKLKHFIGNQNHYVWEETDNDNLMNKIQKIARTKTSSKLELGNWTFIKYKDNVIKADGEDGNGNPTDGWFF